MNDTDTIKYVEEQLTQCKPEKPIIAVFSGRCVRRDERSAPKERSLEDEEWLVLPRERSDRIEYLKRDYDEFFCDAVGRGYYKIRIICNNRQCVFEYGRHDDSELSMNNFMQPAVIFNLPHIAYGGMCHRNELHEVLNRMLGSPAFPMNHLCFD